MAIKCPKCQHENPDETVYCGKCATPLQPSKNIEVTKTLETPIEQLPAGSTLAGRYRIIEELGKGGMGTVYKAHDQEINEEVAIKLLKTEIARDEKTIERFRNELKIARSVSHKHVCRMYDIGREDDRYFITMEYVAGEDLKSLIREKEMIPEGEVLRIAQQICEGLIGAHELGIVHRDLKPQNIMMDRKGDAKIMDFGIARSLEAPGVTQTGVIIGTPDYISPEQAEGQEADHRSDIYSLGVILYEMVTGTLPFKGDTALSVALKHKSQLPSDPRKLNPKMSDDLSRLILICMEKDRERRYQTVKNLLVDLQNIQEGFPLGTKIRPRRETFMTTLIQKKILIPAVALLVIAAIVLVLLLPRGPSLNPSRVVVDVFENQTGDLSLDSMGRIAAGWIKHGLEQTGLFTVTSLAPDETLKSMDKEKDRIHFLAKKAGAGKSISGAFYLQENMIRFHAQVRDEKRNEVLSALSPVSGPREDPLKAIELLRQRIMGVLATVSDSMVKPYVDIARQPPTYEAYQEYIEAGEMFLRMEFKKAIEHYLKAVNIDPTFKHALVWVVQAYWNLEEYAEANAICEELAEFRERLSRHDQLYLDVHQARLRGNLLGALKAARQLAILTQSAIWYHDLASYAIRCNYPNEAIEAIKKVNPERDKEIDWPSYWYIYTQTLHMLGRHKKELKIARRGRKRFPELHSTLRWEARALAALGRIKEINKLIDESLSLPAQTGNPGLTMLNISREMRAHESRQSSLLVLERAVEWFRSRPKEESETRSQRFGLARVLYEAEKWKEAQDIFEALHKEFPEDIRYLGYLGSLAARRNDKKEALRISNLLENIDRLYIFGDNTYWRARIASLLDEKENAVRLLREALAQGINYVQLHPVMDLEPLQDYPPFKELIKPKG